MYIPVSLRLPHVSFATSPRDTTDSRLNTMRGVDWTQEHSLDIRISFPTLPITKAAIIITIITEGWFLRKECTRVCKVEEIGTSLGAMVIIDERQMFLIFTSDS